MLINQVRVVSDTRGSMSCCIFGLILLILIAVFVTQINRKKKKTTNIEPTTSPNTAMNVVSKPQKEDDRKLITTTSDRFVEVDLGLHTNRSGYSISDSYESESSKFVKDAKEKHSIEGKPVPYHVVMQYWPTFRSLTADQEKWYFYWRSEIRGGHFLSTDASYIFIYVYELLCLVENPNPAEAAEQIKKLWEVYHTKNASLDRYLLEWAGDLIATELGISHCLIWWTDLIKKNVRNPPTPILNMIIQQAINEGRISDLPTNIWARLNLYQPRNKFYEQYNRDGIIDQVHTNAIIGIDSYLSEKKSGKGLLERYSPPKKYSQTKRTFTSAIVPDSYQNTVCYGDAQNFVDAPRLGNILLSITK